MTIEKRRTGLVGKRVLERQRKLRDDTLRKLKPAYGITEFELIVERMTDVPKEGLRHTFLVIGGREISLLEGLNRCWNCTAPLTGPLRRKVADILNYLSPRVVDGRHQDHAYWGTILYGRNVSHAARALQQALGLTLRRHLN